MAQLDFCDKHNMVAFLEKSTGSVGFHQIIDFISRSHICYALTKKPEVCVSFIKQFWRSAAILTDDNGNVKIHATIDGHSLSLTEGSLWRHLKLDDQDGVSSLPTTEIFAQLARMGYATDSDKLTFQKGAFSPQWRFLIHNILHCLSPKKTAWEQFSSNIAAAVICLATDRKFNFSRMIFDHMVSNISSPHKFLMYPRFVQLCLDMQRHKLQQHSRVYSVPSLTMKIGVLEAEVCCEMTKKTYNTEVGVDDSSKQGRKFSNEGVQDDEGVQEKASTETELFIQEVTPTEVIHEQEGSGKASDEVVTKITAGGTVTYSRRSAEKRTRQDKGKGILVEEEPKKKSKKELEQERLSYAEAIRLEEQMNEEQRAQIARDAEIARQWDEEEKKRAMDEAETTKKIDWNDPSVIRYHSLKMKPNAEKGKLKSKSSLKKKGLTKKIVEEEALNKRKGKKVVKNHSQEFLDIVPREEAPIEIESLSTKFPSCKWKDSCVDGDLSYTIKFSETMLYGCHRGMENFPSNPKPKQQQMADSSSTIIKSNPVTLKKRRQKKMIKPNGSQLVYEDLEQIHEDGIEEMDLKWQLALLSMRTKMFSRKLVERSLSMGVTQLDMTNPRWSVSTTTRWDTLHGNVEDLGTKIAKIGIKTTIEGL
ncbi:hypothetical protein Tco_0949033 [Tanacetum coccineum]